ncbi:PepSY-like domain-containing protein [Gemmata sp. JC673]|uniref:PepSY-like domain-containing protein n=1 Tax=Gemmata algarum TaxID=2975278 RepID=A0ABU5ESU1_9BACT|nr:PepSY-like domain-containing protein [Gemmata algarum]MDY3558166.1 PepSY-like domain-containing protein [Gemmata algarum]
MRTMLRVMVAVVAGAIAAAGVRADEEKVPLDKLPKAVADAVKKRFPKGELVEAAKETEGDKVEYEVTVKDGGTKIDVMLTPDGKITVIEKQLAAKDLPKAVTEALGAKYPKATLKTVEEVIKVKDGKEALDFYEVLVVTADKKTFEVKLTAEGKITETDEKKEEKKGKK